jgi:hypothetical protein
MPQHDTGGYRRYSQGSHSAVNIAGSVQAFITTMDSLKLNMAAVDQVWQDSVAAAEACHTVFTDLMFFCYTDFPADERSSDKPE